MTLFFLLSCPLSLSFGLALTACPSFPFYAEPVLTQRGTAMAPIIVGWLSIPGLEEPAFSSWAPCPVLWGGSTRSCFLGKQQWTLFSRSHISQILIFACWPSSLQLFPTADHFLLALLAASDVPALLGSQPPGLRQMQRAAVACGLGLWSESTAGSLGKSGCVPASETSGLKPGWAKQLHKNLQLLYFIFSPVSGCL